MPIQFGDFASILHNLLFIIIFLVPNSILVECENNRSVARNAQSVVIIGHGVKALPGRMGRDLELIFRHFHR